jgi:hypothetical protein
MPARAFACRVAGLAAARVTGGDMAETGCHLDGIVLVRPYARRGTIIMPDSGCANRKATSCRRAGGHLTWSGERFRTVASGSSRGHDAAPRLPS